MAGEVIQFQQSSPSDWQSFLSGIGNSALRIAESRLSVNEDRVSQVQQAPSSAAGEWNKYIPLAVVGLVVLVGLVLLRKR